ncbi:hypothetical protein WJX81_008045 [Elliptochloris bilobata]|uniref:Kinesin motor domain-containing protein n=1 Tax=Elliptochloris bilobata TaxID=381761 RepID=A0AAW1RMS3_9CHLO
MEELEAVSAEPSARDAEAGEECAVCVCVHVRPLIEQEVLEGCQECLKVTPGQPQVCTGPHSFTFDHVYGGGGASPELLYEQCIQPLVAGLFSGFNATCLAYGQTGSGKTYTMGSSFSPEGAPSGVIPRVMDTIFERIAAASDASFAVRVGFVEIIMEEIRDLLVHEGAPPSAVHIREVRGGGVCLVGAAEKEVSCKAEMAAVLEQGSLLRATAATGMNKRSSRSHAIFTITLEQRRCLPAPGGAAGGLSGDEGDGGDSADDEAAVEDYLCAKMHLVDLAGSERLKRTKAEGARQAEGININRGLLELGNVIKALAAREAHVPYRNTKLTRMLQDSLGGNSRTVMIACVSPADINVEESLNTLRYASRARNIRNKPVVNRDPNAAQVAQLRQENARLRAEAAVLRRRVAASENGAAPPAWEAGGVGRPDTLLQAALAELQAQAAGLEVDNARMRLELEAVRQELVETSEQLIIAQAARDRNALRIQQLSRTAAAEGVHAGGNAARLTSSLTGDKENAIPGGAGGEGEGGDSDGDLIQGYLARIARLEKEVRRLRQVQRCSGSAILSARRQSRALSGGLAGTNGSPAAGGLPVSPLLLPGDAAVARLDMGAAEAGGDGRGGGGDEPGEGSGGDSDGLADDEEFAVEEEAHRAEQARAAGRLDALQRALEGKEAEMVRLAGGEGRVSALKAQFDAALAQLAEERNALQRERSQLVQRIASLLEASEEDRLRLQHHYRERLAATDAKMKEVRAKERRAAQLEALQRRSQEKCSHLQADIQAIKQQKVALARQIAQSAKEFADWRRRREREIATLRRAGVRQQAQVHRLEAVQAKQAAVLRRKTEEADAARRRLKEMVEVHRAARSEADARRERSASAAAARPGAPAGPECQPNAGAPLLRDERARREWLEHELGLACQSHELQRVLEGEKALRAEAARRLADLQRQATLGRSSRPQAALAADAAALEAQVQQHSAQIAETQEVLMRAKAEEEARVGSSGDGAAAARRWTGVRGVVEARSLLKTLFRAASHYKAQAYEAAGEAVEAREEAEMLRLQLDCAREEREGALRATAAAQAGLAAALAAQAEDEPLMLPAPAESAQHEALDAEVASLLQEIDALPDDSAGAPPEEPDTLPGTAQAEGPMPAPAAAAPAAAGPGDGERAEGLDTAEGEAEEDEEEDEEEEEEDEWEPGVATPWRGRRALPRAGARSLSGGSASAASGGGVCTPTTSQRVEQASAEAPVLMAINAARRRAGQPAAARLTVPLLKEHLRGKVIGGVEWRPGSKKRDDLVADFRGSMGLRSAASTMQRDAPPVPDPPASARGGWAARGEAMEREEAASRAAATAAAATAAAGGEGASAATTPVASFYRQQSSAARAREVPLGLMGTPARGWTGFEAGYDAGCGPAAAWLREPPNSRSPGGRPASFAVDCAASLPASPAPPLPPPPRLVLGLLSANADEAGAPPDAGQMRQAQEVKEEGKTPPANLLTVTAAEPYLLWRVAHTAKLGRRAVAKRDVAPGELVLREAGAATIVRHRFLGRVCCVCFNELPANLAAQPTQEYKHFCGKPLPLLRCGLADVAALVTHWARAAPEWRVAVSAACHELASAAAAAGGYAPGTPEQLQDLAACVNTNAHGVGTANEANADMGLGLFPALSMLNHSCRPNCVFAGGEMHVRPIPAGAQLTVAYVNLLEPRAVRRAELAATKHFTCACERCCEPLETSADRLLEAVPCRAVGCKGELLEQHPASSYFSAPPPPAAPPPWRCTVCGAEVPGSNASGSGPGDMVARSAALWQEARSTLALRGHAAARPLLEALTGMAPRQLGPHHVHVLDSRMLLVNAARAAGDATAAARELGAVLATMDAVVGVPTPELGNLAALQGELLLERAETHRHACQPARALSQAGAGCLGEGASGHNARNLLLARSVNQQWTAT